jgi:hypothetical protein
MFILYNIRLDTALFISIYMFEQLCTKGKYHIELGELADGLYFNIYPWV